MGMASSQASLNLPSDPRCRLGLIGYALWTTETTSAEGRRAARMSARRSTMESASVDTVVKGHKVITGGGIDSYALTLPVVLEVRQRIIS